VFRYRCKLIGGANICTYGQKTVQPYSLTQIDIAPYRRVQALVPGSILARRLKRQGTIHTSSKVFRQVASHRALILRPLRRSGAACTWFQSRGYKLSRKAVRLAASVESSSLALGFLQVYA
jgi:hypothetical protein